MSDCDTRALEISSFSSSSPVPLHIFDHDGNIGVVGNYKLYNKHNRDSVLPLVSSLCSRIVTILFELDD